MKDLETIFREHRTACENIISQPSGDIVSQIVELQNMFDSESMGEMIQNIQYEAFSAGFLEGFVQDKSVDCAQSLDYTVCDKFEEWVNKHE